MALSGKTGLILGVANKRSIAWGVAKAWANAGASIHLVCQSERFLPNVKRLVADASIDCTVDVCDVTDDAQLRALGHSIQDRSIGIDAVLHSVAFAPSAAMRGRFLDTSRSDFAEAHDVSAYSLIALARTVEPFLRPDSSITTVSYMGSTRVVPGYNAMGCAKASLEAAARGLAHELGPSKVRVNVLSPGPIKTVASRGIKGFSALSTHVEEVSPLGWSPTENSAQEAVGKAAVFLASDAASCMSGQVVVLDGGFSIMMAT
uniref:Enoyl-[acyl-carrier-protein] reductase (NADH) n=1 Tax=Octactis speculum TaxID=3111310 RepID=A0A7S2G7W2_9STRA|mmetsp:Transcript_40845/g.55617  ORF Transcript_40845/g.55617 Transcript_40845/m.55617 type:complete len:261 (+) Transcript_40845:62-844(+)